MNELAPSKLDQDKVEDIYQFHKTVKKKGSINRPHAGMKLFAVSFDTYKASPVVFEQATLPVPSNQHKVMERLQLALPNDQIHYKVTVDERMWYVWSINADNAERKFKKYLKFLKRLYTRIQSKSNANNSR